MIDQIISGFLSGKIPEKKDTMFWITLLIISFSIPLSIYGYIVTKQIVLLLMSVSLTVGFILLWIIVFIQEKKWLKLEEAKLKQTEMNTQQLFSYINLGFLLWLSEKKYLPKEVGRAISKSFYDSLKGTADPEHDKGK